MSATLEGRDMYLRYTNRETGRTHVQQHRVWDGEQFFRSQSQAHHDPKNPADRTDVTLATREEYLKSREAR